MIFLVKEIVARRNLIRELVMKDLKVRYSRPILGFFWMFLSPFLIVLIFYAIFSLVLKVEIKEAPFVLYLMSAIFPWYFFQNSLINTTTSLVDNRNLIKESNIPHYFVPLCIVFANAIIFFPSLCIVLLASFLMFRGLPILILFLPFVLAIHVMITIGLSILISVLYVRWRDIKYILEALLLLLFYATPVFYSLSLVRSSFPDFLFKTYIYNPFVGMLDLYRVVLIKGFYAALYKETGFLSLIFMPVSFAVFIFLLGVFYYRKNKDTLNDYLSY